MRIAVAFTLPLLLTGCIARTAIDVATLPVRAVSKTADVLTTSQSEADEKRGRALRKYEQCVAREDRAARRNGTFPDFDKCREP